MQDPRHGLLHGLRSRENSVWELGNRNLSNQEPGMRCKFPSLILVYITKGHIHGMHQLITRIVGEMCLVWGQNDAQDCHSNLQLCLQVWVMVSPRFLPSCCLYLLVVSSIHDQHTSHDTLILIFIENLHWYVVHVFCEIQLLKEIICAHATRSQ